MNSAARWPTIAMVACGPRPNGVGSTEPSTTHSPSTPCTRHRGSTTASSPRSHRRGAAQMLRGRPDRFAEFGCAADDPGHQIAPAAQVGDIGGLAVIAVLDPRRDRRVGRRPARPGRGTGAASAPPRCPAVGADPKPVVYGRTSSPRSTSTASSTGCPAAAGPAGGHHPLGWSQTALSDRQIREHCDTQRRPASAAGPIPESISRCADSTAPADSTTASASSRSGPSGPIAVDADGTRRRRSAPGSPGYRSAR